MKKIVLLILINTIILNSKVLENDKLPINSKEFINLIYPNIKIKEVKLNGYKYEVVLTNNTTLYFANNGAWIEVNGLYNEPIPKNILPNSVLESMLENIKNPKILNISKLYKKYKILLYDKYELYSIIISENGELLEKEKYKIN